MASTRKSAVFRAASKSSTKGTERLCSWVLRRWLGSDFLLFFFASTILLVWDCVLHKAPFCPALGSTATGCSRIGLGGELLRDHPRLVVC